MTISMRNWIFIFVWTKRKAYLSHGKLETMAKSHLEWVSSVPLPHHTIAGAGGQKWADRQAHTWLSLIHPHTPRKLNHNSMRGIQEGSFALYFPHVLDSCLLDFTTPDRHLPHSIHSLEAPKATRYRYFDSFSHTHKYGNVIAFYEIFPWRRMLVSMESISLPNSVLMGNQRVSCKEYF